MPGRFDGKVALVTGGASGIGRATVRRLLDEGGCVVAADLNEANGKELLDEATGEGRSDRLRVVRADVASEADVEAAVAEAVDAFGRLDVVHNNAGVGGAIGPITEIELDDWNYTVGVLLTGVFLGVKHGARRMQAQGQGGAIVNTASVAGLSGGAGPQAYSACKAAVINLTRACAIELAAHRIRVNAVCPGAINTSLINFGNADAVGTMLDGVQPWPAHATGEHVASVVAFLASDDAEFVTGEAVVVDGGLTAAGPSLSGRMGMDAMWAMRGVSRGSTGEPSTFR